VFVSDEDDERQRPQTLTPGERKRLKGLEQRKARQLSFAKKHHRGKYSNRLRKTTAAIAAIRARQARRRADWNHKLTSDLTQNHGVVAVEDLRVSNMVRSTKGTIERPGCNVRSKAGLNRSIADQGWYEIRRQLGYKTRRHGGELIVVPAPGSSQTCNQCKTQDPESRTGCGRLFACVHCGHTEHADRNAALTILDRAVSTAGRKYANRRKGGACRARYRQATEHAQSPPGARHPHR
jgi:putative transposase